MPDKQKNATEIIKQARTIGTGMFTSVHGERELATRPMHLAHVDDDNSLWFFTRLDSDLADEIEQHHQVCIGFSSPEQNSYVAIRGDAETVIDSAKKEELWFPLLRSWFPEGVEDPQCILIKVEPHVLESWEGSSWKIVQLTEQIMAIALGKQAKTGEHVVVEQPDAQRAG